MKHDPVPSAVDRTLLIYLLMNRRSPEQEEVVRAMLTLHFNQLIANGEHEQQLVIKGLTLLRELGERRPVRAAGVRIHERAVRTTR
jgi:hypothetical protein